MQDTKKALTGIVGVLGRVLLCAVFVTALTGHAVPDVHSVASLVAANGSVGPKWAFIGSILLLVVGSFSIIVGYKARIGASLLLAFLVLATLYSHGFTFWTLANAQARQAADRVHLTVNPCPLSEPCFHMLNGAGRRT